MKYITPTYSQRSEKLRSLFMFICLFVFSVSGRRVKPGCKMHYGLSEGSKLSKNYSFS